MYIMLALQKAVSIMLVGIIESDFSIIIIIIFNVFVKKSKFRLEIQSVHYREKINFQEE